MTRKSLAAARRLLEFLQEPGARLIGPEEGNYRLARDSQPTGARVSGRLVRSLATSGLLEESAPGTVTASAVAQAWLKRQGDPELGFLRQHHTIEAAVPADRAGPAARKNVEESPVAALARRAGPHGGPYLSAEAMAAAERFRRDFEIGQLRPQVTANWSASVSRGKRAAGAGLTELTDMALAARRRADKAIETVGPELSGLLVDVCCFLKGLESVERERQWPARSAKLVLRLALQALARHYGLDSAATGKRASALRHWGADGYRPQIS